MANCGSAKAGCKRADLRIDMHQMPIDRWLEGLVDPDDFSAAGNVGGEVVITGDLQNGFLANGKLTLLNGRVQFGFLRSPIFVHPAIVTIRDRTLVVSMPAAELEKSPIDFDITVPDLGTPSIRIDANVQRLDIEVLKFVRLPWMPPTPTHPPKIPDQRTYRRARGEPRNLRDEECEDRFQISQRRLERRQSHRYELRGPLEPQHRGPPEGRLDPHVRQGPEHECRVVVPAEPENHPLAGFGTSRPDRAICGPTPMADFFATMAGPRF